MLKILGCNWCGTAVLALLVAGSGLTLQAQTATAARTATQAPAHESLKTSAKASAARKKQKAKKQAIVVPAPPPPPPTPEQMPAQPPQVSYSEGQLTINADNSTMNDVLAGIRRVTGASIEKPPVGGNDRVVVHLGPGDPKDVLTALFNGSRYDYIILGPMGQPGGVQRIILTARSNAPSQPSAATNAAVRPNVAPPPPAEQEEPDTSDTEDMTVPEQNAPEQEQQQPPQAYPQPGAPGQPQMQNPQGQEEQGQEPQQPHVKTPEELLRELQQMQKQQQNQQQPPQ